MAGLLAWVADVVTSNIKLSNETFHLFVRIVFLNLHCFTKDHKEMVLEQAVVFGKERRGRAYI